MRKLKVYTDSRGGGLDRVLQASDTLAGVEISVETLPGATYDSLFRRLRRDALEARAEDKILVVIAGGICSLTTRSAATEDAPARMSYRSSLHKNEQIKEDIQNIIRHTKQRNLDLVITTIPPASLAAYHKDAVQKFLEKKKEEKSRRRQYRVIHQGSSLLETILLNLFCTEI